MGLRKPAICLNCKISFRPAYSSTGKYCNNKCQQEYQQNSYINEWLKGNKIGGTEENVSHRIKKYLFKINNNSCSKCGWNEINKYSNKCPLQINHIDGNATNNKPFNLELLCPNCHSLTYNFGNFGNRTSSRINRKKRYSSFITKTYKNKRSL